MCRMLLAPKQLQMHSTMVIIIIIIILNNKNKLENDWIQSLIFRRRLWL